MPQAAGALVSGRAGAPPDQGRPVEPPPLRPRTGAPPIPAAMPALSAFFLLSALALSACSASQLPNDASDADLQFDGAVAYTDLEGGAWVIQADEGTTYEPVNLAAEDREEGLRVRVWADRREEMASTLMVGPIIEIRRLERL